MAILFNQTMHVTNSSVFTISIALTDIRQYDIEIFINYYNYDVIKTIKLKKCESLTDYCTRDIKYISPKIFVLVRDGMVQGMNQKNS